MRSCLGSADIECLMEQTLIRHLTLALVSISLLLILRLHILGIMFCSICILFFNILDAQVSGWCGDVASCQEKELMRLLVFLHLVEIRS